jgi:hypothetical protein
VSIDSEVLSTVEKEVIAFSNIRICCSSCNVNARCRERKPSLLFFNFNTLNTQHLSPTDFCALTALRSLSAKVTYEESGLYRYNNFSGRNERPLSILLILMLKVMIYRNPKIISYMFIRYHSLLIVSMDLPSCSELNNHSSFSSVRHLYFTNISLSFQSLLSYVSYENC